MLIVVSPAKKLDYQSVLPKLKTSIPLFLEESELLIGLLRRFSVQEVAALMGLSDNLAALNVARYASWEKAHNAANSRPAVFAFKGDVYQGLKADTLSPTDIAWAGDHFRILSGLYGVLRPLDLMQAYRLEMGTALANPRGKDLYGWWRGIIAPALREALDAQGDNVLLNLASSEYFKAVDARVLNARVVAPQFRDLKNGQYKIISFYAKRARGLMASWVIRQQVGTPEELVCFADEGYAYNPGLSKPDEPVFTRDEPFMTEEDEDNE